MTRPTPVPSQCKHDRSYYDEKGLRCKACHKYLQMKPLPSKGSPDDNYEPPLEREYPELWAEPTLAQETAEEMGCEGW